MAQRKEWHPKKSAFIIVGRIPEKDNETFEVTADNEEEALRKFSDALWAGRPEQRKEFLEAEGFDHYVDVVIEVQGRYRVLQDTYGGGTDKWTVPK